MGFKNDLESKVNIKYIQGIGSVKFIKEVFNQKILSLSFILLTRNYQISKCSQMNGLNTEISS